MADMGDIGAGAAGILGGVVLAGVAVAGAGAVIRSVENMSNSINAPAATQRRRKTVRKVKRTSPSLGKMNKNMAPGAKKVNKMVFG